MSKKIIVVMLLFAGLLFVNVPVKAQAQSPLPELPSAGLTPNSPFYFLEVIVEEIGEFFTFNAEARAKLQNERALERVAEVKAMLAKEEVNPERLNVALRRLQGHMERAANIIQRLVEQERNVETLATELDISFGFVNQHLKNVFEESKERMERAAELAEQALERRFAEPAFVQAMEDALLRIAADIDEELGRPLDGFTVIEDETNVDVDDDTYSATHRAEAPQLMDLAALRDRILARGVENRWESGDVVLDDDSLDITFEKTYGPIDIMGEKLFAKASVTISATINSPETGMTEINYDIDITLEGEHGRFLDILGGLKEEMDDDFNVLSDVLEEQMGLENAVLNLMRELEEEKQELLDEAANEDIVVPAGVFGTFDSLLAQAKSALAAGNWEEAKRLAKQAEKNLDAVGKAIEDLAGAKEKEAELKEKQEEKEREIKEEQEETIREEAEKEVERLEKEREKAEEATQKAEEQLRDIGDEGATQEAEEQLRDVGDVRDAGDEGEN